MRFGVACSGMWSRPAPTSDLIPPCTRQVFKGAIQVTLTRCPAAALPGRCRG